MTVAGQLGPNLRKIRRRADLGQDDLSRRSGLHHTEISLPGRGGRITRLVTCIRILESAGADASDLVGGVGRHGPARWDETGWFTIVGLVEPAAVRPRRGARAG